jgi:hypothetical protein
MIVRAITLAAGLAGGAALSQFPEFSQHYVQRLSGAVDALGQVVADFDTSAAAEGLTREAALAQMTGSAFVSRRQKDMAATFDRHARLSAELDALREAGPFARAWHVARLDGEIVRATWADFRPALPLTMPGAVFGAAGFLAASLLMGGILRGLGRLSGLRRATN